MEAETLKITYKTKKLERQCTKYKDAVTVYGTNMAVMLMQRITELKAIDSVESLLKYSVGRCHKLQGNRKNEYAMDLVHPYRLVFEKHEDVVQAVKIISVEDYH